MLELNSEIFYFLSGLRSISWIGIMADFPIFFLPLFLSWMWLYFTFKHTSVEKRIQLIHIFYGCVIGIVFSYIIKQFIEIERPESYLEVTGNLIMSHLPEKSFPSDHATVSFAFLTGLFFTGWKKVWWIFLPFVIFMNICRIIVWVHWPLDIFVGSIVWISSACLLFLFINKLKLVKNLDLIIIKMMTFFKLY